MTEAVILKATHRDASVKRSGKKAVRAGFIPGVVYGPKTEPFPINVDPKEVEVALTTEYGRNKVITVEVEGGASHMCMVKDTQFNPVRREMTHMDMYVVDPEQEVVVPVPVKPTGRSAGEKLGGLLQIVSRTVNVRCKVKDIPVAVEHDVSDVELSEAVYVDEMSAPDACSVEFKHRFPVIRIAARRGAKMQAEEETETEAAEE